MGQYVIKNVTSQGIRLPLAAMAASLVTSIRPLGRALIDETQFTEALRGLIQGGSLKIELYDPGPTAMLSVIVPALTESPLAAVAASIVPPPGSVAEIAAEIELEAELADEDEDTEDEDTEEVALTKENLVSLYRSDLDQVARDLDVNPEHHRTKSELAQAILDKAESQGLSSPPGA